MTPFVVAICLALLVMTPDWASAQQPGLDYRYISLNDDNFGLYVGSKFSADSKFLAIATKTHNGGNIWLHRFNEHGLPVLATTKPLSGVWPVALSANSKFLAVGEVQAGHYSDDPTAVQMYRLDNDSGLSVNFTLDSFCRNQDYCLLQGMEFSSDSKLLAIVTVNSSISTPDQISAWIYNIADGGNASLKCTFEVGPWPSLGYPAPAQVNPVFSGDSKFLAINSAGTNQTNVYSNVDGSCPTLVYSLPPVASVPTGLAFSNDSHYLAMSFGSSVQIYDMHSPQQFNLKDANADVVGIAFSPDSKQLAAKSRDGGGHLWVYSFQGGTQPRLNYSIGTCVNGSSGYSCAEEALDSDFFLHLDCPSFSADSTMVTSSYYRLYYDSSVTDQEFRLYYRSGSSAAQAPFDSASLVFV